MNPTTRPSAPVPLRERMLRPIGTIADWRFSSQMAMGAEPFAIMKVMGHADIKTTMIYVSLGRSCRHFCRHPGLSQHVFRELAI
jgi:hypothetical protein